MTLTPAMLLLVRTVVEAPDGLGLAGHDRRVRSSAALLAAFVAIEQRRRAARAARHPALGPLVRANLGMMTLFGAYVGFQFVMTLYLQAMNGWSPVETALAFLPAGMLVAVGVAEDRAARRSPRRAARDRASARRHGDRLRARAALRRAPDYVAVLLPTMLLIGIGFMLCSRR